MSSAATLVHVKQKARSDESPEQRRFCKLQKKVETLKKKEERLVLDLDRALQYMYGTIYPLEKEIEKHLMERVRLSYNFYTKDRRFFHADRDILRELIVDDVAGIFQTAPLGDVPDDIKQIFKRLHGVNYEEALAEEAADAKEELREMFKGMGVDVDLSDIIDSDDRDEIAQKVFQSFGEAVQKREGSSQVERKSKKQIQRELQQSQIEEMQKKSLNTVYKQLVKALHPDLEPDSAKKIEKAELMKKVTTAYEKNDLHTLLSLEFMWINGLNAKQGSRTKDQLKIYNEILQEQVEALEGRLHFTWDFPKYFPLHRFYHSSFVGPWVLQKVYTELTAKEKHFKKLVEQMKTPAIVSILKRAILDARG